MEKQLARRIVNTIKGVIHYEVNFFNLNGVTIASTDESRIGKLHDGALRVIRTRDDVTVEHNNEEKNMKKGYNTAVYNKNEIIGAVGVTGEPTKVSKYTKIIRKITELMISENHLQKITFNQRQTQQAILEHILSNEHLEANTGLIANHNFYQKRRVIYSEINYISNLNIDLYAIISNFFHNRNNIIAINNSRIIIITDIVSKNELTTIISNINQNISNKTERKLQFSISNIYENLQLSKNAFKKAQFSWKILEKRSKVKLLFSEDLNIEYLFMNHSKKELKKYIDSVLGNLNNNEIEKYSFLFNEYEKYNGSLKKSSEHLYIHKNTLQYRLNRFGKLTGYNPRELSDYVIIKTAFMAYNIIN